LSIIDRRGITVDGTPSSASSFLPSANLAIKTPCRATTTASITLAELQTIDGVALVADDRVLVKDQSDATENGIYRASNGSWSRTTDLNGANEIVTGTIVVVNEGAVNGNKEFRCTSSDPLIPGTSSLAFASIGAQPLDATLSALSAAATAADKLPYFSGVDTVALADFTAAARTLLDDATVAAMRTTLGLAIGTNVQAYDADLDAWAGKTAPTGTVVGTSDTQELTDKTLTSAVAKGTWTVSGTWTIPAVTLGGTVSGGGNQINNVIIGTSTPLAGSFTTLDASTSLTTPIHKSAAAIDFQTNGTTFAGNVTAGQQWYYGPTKAAPQTGPVLTVSKNATTPSAVGTPGGISGTAQILANLVGSDAAAADIIIQSFNNSAGAVRYLSAAGTNASKTATTATSLGVNFAYGYTGSVYVSSVGFVFTATETYSGSASGGRLDLYATPTGTTGITIAASVGAGFMVGDQIDPGAGAISATGSIKSKSGTAGVGYATGAGGAVTQGTSRTTGVTLNKVCGGITLFAAAPVVGTWVSFTVTNSTVAATDVPYVSVKSGTNTYIAHVTAVAAGSFQISFTSIVGTASDSPVINFAVTKAVAA
jgi:hypothetical protein